MADEDFCLKWNDHHSVFFSLAEELLQQGSLADVTLATGKSSFPAHRLVLSVCSTFFSRLFSKQDKGYIVYLKDVPEKHLEMLLSFMYRGEVNCADSQLVNFLATARGLGIKGLSEVQNFENTSLPPKKKAKVSGKRNREEFILGGQESLNQKNKKQNQVQTEESQESINQQNKKQNQVQTEESQELVVEVVPKIEEMSEELEDDAEMKQQEEESQVGAEGTRAFNSLGETLECPYCPKVLASSYGLKRHALTHEKKRYKCEYCEKLLSRKDNLIAHQRNVHGHVFESETHGSLPIGNAFALEREDGSNPAA